MSMRHSNKENKFFFHFYIKISGKDYAISTLKLDLDNNQIFYRFNCPKTESEKELVLLDHISFHSGQTHIKLNNNKILVKKADTSLPLEGESKIILYQGFLLDRNELHLLQENVNFNPKWYSAKGLNQEILIADLARSINFSLLLVLVPNDYKNVLSLLEACGITDKDNLEIKLSSLRHPEFKSGIIEAFENHSILVLATPYIHDSSKDKDEPMWKIFHPIFPMNRV